MSYRTILVHLNQEKRARALLGVGVDLAVRFEAHLIGCHVFPAFRLSPPLPLPFGGDVAGQIRGAIEGEQAAIKATFDDVMHNQPFDSEWRSVTNDKRDPARVLIEQAHAAELVIAAQPDPDWEMSDVLDFPERLALGAGRPVLVVPNFGRHPGLPRTVMVAWKAGRESARAVWDALPLLQVAERVVLMTVSDKAGGESGQADSDIASALSRRGVKVEAARAVATEATVGEEIRVRTAEQRADLLVMGCYGHSRFREYALGGVTRHMLREMTIPILFSH